jgi:Putative quorum-sensing-regulated virulence factor
MDEAGETIFPFGKHKGERLRDIPIHYLDWALGIDLRDDLRAAVQAYLKTQAEYDQLNGGAKDWREGREDYVEGED